MTPKHCGVGDDGPHRTSIFGVNEGNRTPGLQGHNLTL
ncbi:MAG: hypothetical protein RL391_1866 [Actinomycetota bacterium]